jgi:small-conductance mechanosensitive channel
VREELPKIGGAVLEPPPRIWLAQMEANSHRYILKVWIEDFRIHDEVESEVLKTMWYRLQAEGYPLVLATAVRVEKAG